MSENVGSYLDVPRDAKVLAPWFPLVRRMRERAISGGYTVLKVTVVCNESGYPVQWLEPEALRVEPCGAKTALTQLLEVLAR